MKTNYYIVHDNTGARAAIVYAPIVAAARELLDRHDLWQDGEDIYEPIAPAKAQGIIAEWRADPDGDLVEHDFGCTVYWGPHWMRENQIRRWSGYMRDVLRGISNELRSIKRDHGLTVEEADTLRFLAERVGKVCLHEHLDETPEYAAHLQHPTDEWVVAAVLDHCANLDYRISEQYQELCRGVEMCRHWAAR